MNNKNQDAKSSADLKRRDFLKSLATLPVFGAFFASLIANRIKNISMPMTVLT